LKKVLGIDYGDRRIGIAISDPLQIIASPLKVINCKEQQQIINEIRNITDSYNIDTVVVGLPLTLKGKHSKQTEKTIKFIENIKKNINVSTKTVDERMTSLEAEKILIQKGIKTGHNKSKIDLTAAVIILQEYLDSK
tara:strand:- start:1848 stop:2258 length:411 start_codon:yes stop_codon:yes gene_type:complete